MIWQILDVCIWQTGLLNSNMLLYYLISILDIYLAVFDYYLTCHEM